ncbi:AAA family ATPase [Noviherbaspirillum agri]
MYIQFFRLTQAPFSISPDPRYLFMSERHREALAHLLYGINSGGGLVLLTGEIGTGKTTVCRCFLEQLPATCNLAYIFNPKLSVGELLQTICEEFHIELPAQDRHAAGVKDYVDALNRYLLASHAEGRNNVLVIDEAQNLSADVLEQLRLLTNLETNDRKLLQIILIGQPELRAMLSRPELEQLAQRVIAHYHLTALSEQETASYIQHRLATAGLTSASPFQPSVMKSIHRLTQGVPRRINLLCDRALLGAYAKGTHDIDRNMIEQAAGELFVKRRATPAAPRKGWRYAVAGVALGGIVAGAVAWAMNDSALMNSLAARWSTLRVAVADRLNQGTATTPPAPTVAQAPVASSAPEAVPVVATVAAVASGSDAQQNAGAFTGTRDENDAIRHLADMWNVQAEGNNPCAALMNAGVRCHKSAGGLAELRRLDRPAAITLYGPTGRLHYAVLAGLNDTEATLRNGSTTQTISIAALTRHFRGEFVTLWRAPPAFADTAQLGDQGAAVDWIAEQMARMNDSPVPPAGQPFGQTTLRQVRQLQQAHGLFVDGVVGPATAMQINRVAGVDEPRLIVATAARE